MRFDCSSSRFDCACLSGIKIFLEKSIITIKIRLEHFFCCHDFFVSLVEPTNQATSNVEWVWLQGRSREVLPRLGSVHHLHVRPRSKEGGEEGDSFFFCSRHDSFIHPRPLSHPYLCPAPLSGRLPATPKRATTCGLTTWSACTTRRRCVF